MGLKRWMAPLLLALSVLAFVAGPAGAQSGQQGVEASEEHPTAAWAFDLDYNSRYIWYAIPFSRGPVLQPSVTLHRSKLSFNVWSNLNLTGGDHPRCSEVDLTAAYDASVGKLSIEPAFAGYLYPNQTGSTAMAYVRVAYPLVGNLSVFSEQTVDVAIFPGAYFGNVGLVLDRPLGGRASWDVSSAVDWANALFNQTYVGPSIGGVSSVQSDVGFTYQMTEHFAIRPHLEVSALLPKRLRQAALSGTTVNPGVSFIGSF